MAGLSLPSHGLLLSDLILGELVNSFGKSREKIDKQGRSRTMSFHESLTSISTYIWCHLISVSEYMESREFYASSENNVGSAQVLRKQVLHSTGEKLSAWAILKTASSTIKDPHHGFDWTTMFKEQWYFAKSLFKDSMKRFIFLSSMFLWYMPFIITIYP